MTQKEQIEAALEALREDRIYDEADRHFLLKTTIRRALLFTQKAMGEPSDGMRGDVNDTNVADIEIVRKCLTQIEIGTGAACIGEHAALDRLQASLTPAAGQSEGHETHFCLICGYRQTMQIGMKNPAECPNGHGKLTAWSISTPAPSPLAALREVVEGMRQPTIKFAVSETYLRGCRDTLDAVKAEIDKMMGA